MTAMTAVTPDPEEEPVGPDSNAEVDEILQRPTGVVVIDGVECDILRLKTRETFVLLRVLTLGGTSADMIASIFEKDKPLERMAQELMASLIVTLPNAETDVLHLIRHMTGRREGTSDADWYKVQQSLTNPEIETTMEVIQQVVWQEAGELARLGKAARSWWTVMGPELRRRAGRS